MPPPPKPPAGSSHRPPPPAPPGRARPSAPPAAPSQPPAPRASRPPSAAPSQAARPSRPPAEARPSSRPVAAPKGSPNLRRLGPLGVPVHPLVLALDHGLDSRGTSAALEAGQNFVFVAGGATEPALNVLKRALAEDRGRYVVAAAPALGWFGGSFERCADRWCRALGIEHLDVLFALGVGRTSSWSAGVTGALEGLKAKGRIRHVGAGLHARKHARMLLESPLVDFLVVPYSAAHRGAEHAVFPYVEDLRQRRARTPVLLASHATSSRELLRAPGTYQGRIPTAADCYRFCLASRYVDGVFTAPRNLERAAKNIADFEGAGPLRSHEVEWMAHFGDVVLKHEGGGD